MRILDAIKLSDKSKVGFIISLKEYADSYDEIKNANISNVMLRTFCPQREILNHKKTKIFMTHCGANGAIEAMYYGVAMLGFPQ